MIYDSNVLISIVFSIKVGKGVRYLGRTVFYDFLIFLTKSTPKAPIRIVHGSYVVKRRKTPISSLL